MNSIRNEYAIPVAFGAGDGVLPRSYWLLLPFN
jgi:hypothetical protein